MQNKPFIQEQEGIATACQLVYCLINNFTKTVIPAEAGIQTPSLQKQGTIKELDSRLHGNDERKRCIELLGTERY
jgi:hypothetical protein